MARIASRFGRVEPRWTERVFVPAGCPIVEESSKRAAYQVAYDMCGQVDVNEYVLNLNHGLSEIDPDSRTWFECSRRHLLASQAAARIR
jgi:hypothetical protein